MKIIQKRLQLLLTVALTFKLSSELKNCVIKTAENEILFTFRKSEVIQKNR